MKEYMPDLSVEIQPDGTICLEQSSGVGETVRVDLHPVQLRFLCERAGLLKPQPIDLAECLTAGHVRRLRKLSERINELLDTKDFFDEVFDRCPNAGEWWMHLRAIEEQAEELVADIDHSDSGGGDNDNWPVGEVAPTARANSPKPSPAQSTPAAATSEPQASLFNSDQTAQAGGLKNQEICR